MEGFLFKRGSQYVALTGSKSCFPHVRDDVHTRRSYILNAWAGDLVKTWRVRYFVLQPGPSPRLTYYRAIEVQSTIYDQAACICGTLSSRPCASRAKHAMSALQKGEGPTNSWELEGCTVHVSIVSRIALPENSSTP